MILQKPGMWGIITNRESCCLTKLNRDKGKIDVERDKTSEQYDGYENRFLCTEVCLTRSDSIKHH
jgi:hypothetical protein